MFDNIGGGELLVTVFILFLLFGPTKLPEIGRSLGKAMREFRSAMRGVRQDIEKATRMDEVNRR